MPFELREFYGPFTIIAILVGFQTAIYFLYLYYKSRKENLELNKILLAYGLLFIVSLIAITIRTVNSYYNQDPVLNEILIRISNFPLFMSLELYLIIISTKGFEKLANPKHTRIFILIAAIPIPINLILGPFSIFYIVSMMITAPITMIYLLVVQVKMLKLTAGNMRKRLEIITSGLFLIFISVGFGGYAVTDVVFAEFYDVSKLVSIPLLVAGYMIVFFGVYQFPGFLEFNWKENLRQLVVIDSKNYKLIYSYDFEQELQVHKNLSEKEPEEREVFFSKGIIGIDEMISSITNTADKKLKKITHRDFLLLLNHGSEEFSFLTYILLVNREMKSLKYFLKIIKHQFQENYKNVLLNLKDIAGNEDEVFSSFNPILRNMIKYH